MYRTAEKVREEVGNVAVLVNNAAVLPAKSFLDLSDEEIERTFNVNVLGYIWVSVCERETSERGGRDV